MLGDYVVIKHVDNGFTVEINAYNGSKRHANFVAHNEQELYDIIRDKVFPARLLGMGEDHTHESAPV